MPEKKTAQKILDCATKLFAQHGYDGAIMDDLAAQCGVNKASIYYHHHDKATLYEKTLTTLFTPIADSVIEAIAGEKDPVQMLRKHVHAFARASEGQPGFAPILMREMATGGANMPAPARQQMQRILAQLNRILRQGAGQGVFEPADSLMLHLMIIGTINLFVTSIPLRRNLPDMEEGIHIRNTDVDAAAEQLADIIIASLLTEPKSRGRDA